MLVISCKNDLRVVSIFKAILILNGFCLVHIGAGPLKPVLITSIIKCILCLLVNDIDLLEYPSLYSARLLDKVQGEICVTPAGRRRSRHKWVLNGYN